jgi:hypothetical protein
MRSGEWKTTRPVFWDGTSRRPSGIAWLIESPGDELRQYLIEEDGQDPEFAAAVIATMRELWGPLSRSGN